MGTFILHFLNLIFDQIEPVSCSGACKKQTESNIFKTG